MVPRVVAQPFFFSEATQVGAARALHAPPNNRTLEKHGKLCKPDHRHDQGGLQLIICNSHRVQTCDILGMSSFSFSMVDQPRRHWEMFGLKSALRPTPTVARL